ncbi:ATP-binding protein [Algivirga pacifica]|uniref:histidine kinase n=1 Tax=Algivirga pacifica TaxID=1162670 RepID=A0ABP9DHX2_9BACT
MTETPNKATVLYVDDEQQNLVSFKASFRKLFTVLTANSGEEALSILKKKHDRISVVISDQRMPHMTGVELFEKIRTLYPDITRIVLTGYSDIQDIINAISKGEVYRYITKPWNRDELKVTIDNAVEAHQLRTENKKLFADLKEAYSQLEDEAKHLEVKVAERTKELEQQKSALQANKQKLKKRNEELIALDSEKNHLVGIVAHDLKSPLNQILGLLELMSLDDENLTEEQQEYMGLIRESIHRQQDMITQILDVSALEAKKSNAKIKRVNLGKLLIDITDRFTLTAEKKSIALAQDIDSSDETEAMIDENYIVQIFQNLISNAIKFSPENTTITVSLKQEGEHLTASVKDQGPGLTEEDLDKVFGKFQKLSARPTGGEHSTGLGLSIVKKLVENLDGKVWCESVYGNGASFMVQLPKA